MITVLTQWKNRGSLLQSVDAMRKLEDHDSSVDAVVKWKILIAVLTLWENGDHDHSWLTL